MYGVPYETAEYNNMVKIKNMLSTHSFLITSKRYLYILIECMKIAIKYNMHYDIPIARIMHRYNVIIQCHLLAIYYHIMRLWGHEQRADMHTGEGW